MHILGQSTISLIYHTNILFHSVQLNFYKMKLLLLK